MIAKALFTNVTARARAAFAASIAQRNLQRIAHNSNGHALAEASLNRAWDWVEGVPVAPKTLCDALLDENDEGLLTFEYQAADAEKPLWLLIDSAVAYVGWHVYSAANESMPDLISETGEKGLQWVIDFALDVSGSNQKVIDALTAYCLAQHRTNDPNELGAPIPRAAFANIG